MVRIWPDSAVGSDVRHIEVADLDNDLVSAEFNGCVSVLLKNNAMDTFATAVSYAAGSQPLYVEVAEFTGDAFLDLAVANFGGTVTLLKNNGNGTFTPLQTFSGLASVIEVVKVADLDGDGGRDLVATLGSANMVAGFPNDGTGASFTRTSCNTVNAVGLTLTDADADADADANANANANADADADADADKDILATNRSSGSPTVFLKNGTSPDLQITKTDSPDPTTVGQDITYTLTVTNNNATTAATDVLPAGLTFKAAGTSAFCTNASGTVTCDFEGVAAGATDTATVVLPATTAGLKSNTATVDGAEADPTAGNDSSTATTQVNRGSYNPGGGNPNPPNPSPPGGTNIVEIFLDGPPERTRDKIPTFTFSVAVTTNRLAADEIAFRCKVDNRTGYMPCESPDTTEKLSANDDGGRKHRFRVRAFAPDGTKLDTAIDRFQVVKGGG